MLSNDVLGPDPDPAVIVAADAASEAVLLELIVLPDDAILEVVPPIGFCRWINSATAVHAREMSSSQSKLTDSRGLRAGRGNEGRAEARRVE